MTKDSYDRVRKSNPQSLNQYAYCNNNPVTNVDPNGDSWFTAAISAVVSNVVSHSISHSSNSCSNTLLASAGDTTYYWAPTGASGVAISSGLAATMAGAAAFFTTILGFPASLDKDPSEMGITDENFPNNPDDWVPPPGVSETIAGEKTGGKNRQWKNEYGNIVRRWDKGEPGKPGFVGKDHWHDQSGRHIIP